VDKRLTDKIESFLSDRVNAIKTGDTMKANEIASKLRELNVTVRDDRKGTTWKIN
jgi:hypothetical protein